MTDFSTRKAMPGLSFPEESLKRLAHELSARFDGVFAGETVERYVLESYTALLRTSKVKAHLSSRTAHFAGERLTALAQAKGAVVSPIPEVLFVCVQNAGRSQMAAVFAGALSGGAVHVRSAGSMPSTQLNPSVVLAMTELGLSMDEAFPKPLTDDVVQAADVVITMGCGDACPIYPGKRYVDWNLVDPGDLPLETVRGIRDQIRGKVTDMLAGLGVDTVALPGVSGVSGVSTVSGPSA